MNWSATRVGHNLAGVVARGRDAGGELTGEVWAAWRWFGFGLLLLVDAMTPSS